MTRDEGMRKVIAGEEADGWKRERETRKVDLIGVDGKVVDYGRLEERDNEEQMR